MIIMNLELDNIYGFCDFKINFSYPKKIVGSTIDNEFLVNKPNFRYKKVNIIMGSNASGKTTFGRALLNIFHFISNGEIRYLKESINDVDDKAYFSIDFLYDEKNLYRVECVFFKDEKKDYKIEIFKANIAKNDSYESCCKKLKAIDGDKIEHSSDILKILFKDKFGWSFALTNGSEDNTFAVRDTNIDIEVLEKVLQALDLDILSVDKLDVENSYVIRKKKHSIIIQDGQIINENKLSSGTKSGINIANMISSVITNRNGFYFCDEKFSFIHSDLEQAILSILIEKLHSNAQLFFTSHNTELLEMNLPKHSFTFFKKQKCIEIVYPSDYIKKNEASLYLAFKNDLFNVAPSKDKIYEIEDIVYEK